MVKYSQAQLDDAFGALANATRRALLQRLSERPSSISELAREHGVTLAGILKHVRVLEQSRLISTTKEGRSRICALRPGACDAALTWLEDHRSGWESRLDSLEEHLKETGG